MQCLPHEIIRACILVETASLKVAWLLHMHIKSYDFKHGDVQIAQVIPIYKAQVIPIYMYKAK